MSEDIELLLRFLKMFDRISNAEVIQQDKEKILTDFLKAYYSDMYEIEKLHLGDEFDKADKKSCINFKRKIFEKYWHNHESYYEPCSCGNSASFDWGKVSDISFFEKGDDFQQLYLISVTYCDDYKDKRIYMVEYKDGKLGIQHQFFEVIQT